MSTLKKKSGKSKSHIKDKVDQPKETINQHSEVNKKHIAEVPGSTKKNVDSVKDQPKETIKELIEVNKKHIAEVSGSAKKIVDSIKDQPKEAIKELSEVNKKHITEVLDSTKKMVASIKEKLDQQEIEEILIDTLESPIEAAVELVKESTEAFINSYSSQVVMNMDFKTEEADIINEATDTVNETAEPGDENTNSVHPPTMLELIQENVEKVQQLAIKNTEEFYNAFTKNTNLIVGINQKLVESINTQMESILNLQNESLNNFKS